MKTRRERREKVKEEWKAKKRVGKTKLSFTEYWRVKLEKGADK